MAAHKSLPRLLVACLCTLLAPSCANPDPETGSGTPGISLVRYAQIEIEPPTRDVRLLVGGLPIGGDTRYPIVLRNTGERLLQVRSVALFYAGPSDEEEPAFRLLLPDDVAFDRGPYELQPTGAAGDLPEELEIEVHFTHYDRRPRAARLVIESNSRVDSEIAVIVTTEQGVPVAVVNPAVIDFGNLQQGDVGRVPLTIVNTGAAPLTFSGFQMTGDQHFAFLDSENQLRWDLSLATEDGIAFVEPYRIEPGRSRTFQVEYQAVQSDLKEARIVLFTNARDADGVVIRRLIANRRQPRIEVEPTEVDFGRVAVGGQAVRIVRVFARGSAPLQVRELTLDGGPRSNFSFDLTRIPGFEDGGHPTPQRPIQIAENDFVEIRLLYTPDMEVVDDLGRAVSESDVLSMESDAFSRRTHVSYHCRARASSRPAPSRRSRCWMATRFLPQTVVRLRGPGQLLELRQDHGLPLERRTTARERG
jgi:hypothetical protein